MAVSNAVNNFPTLVIASSAPVALSNTLSASAKALSNAVCFSAAADVYLPCGAPLFGFILRASAAKS